MNSHLLKSEAIIPETRSKVPTEIPVLIVGGGPAGLTTSLLLSRYGIRSLLIEQHPGTSLYPKARLINARTVEIFRQLGIETAIQDVAIPHNRNMVFAPSLASEEFFQSPIEIVLPEFVQDWSPTGGFTTTQEILEPVLLSQARCLEPAQIRFSTQLASFEQHGEHLLATLVHRPSGRVNQVRARYLIGADGAHSTVREALGIRMLGKPILGYRVNILFRADLSPWVGDREINIAVITNPKASGLFLYNGENRWRFTASYEPDQGQRPEDFTPEYCVQLIRTAVGAPELAVELGEITPWNDSALVAERFYDRRIFLTGDATHIMSPMGGFGMNVGIQDAHNLGWKIAAVLKGWGSSLLLSSYETERAPVSRMIVEHSTRNVGRIQGANNSGPNSSSSPGPVQSSPIRPEMGRPHGLVFGAIYESELITPDGSTTLEVSNPVTDYKPNARPGSRAPHVWLERSGERVSTLDLYGGEFVLVAGARGSAWCEAARSASDSLGVPMQTYRIGAEGDLADPDHAWATAYGVDEDGSVLVRPDGYVAWRCATIKAKPILEIEMAMQTALAMNTIQQQQTS